MQAADSFQLELERGRSQAAGVVRDGGNAFGRVGVLVVGPLAGSLGAVSCPGNVE